MTTRERETFAEQMAALLDGIQPGLEDLKNRASQASGDERRFLHEQIALLRDREKAIRYQLGQLFDDASGEALRDLEHGLLIAWERFARDVAQIHWEHPPTRDELETRTTETRTN